MSSCGIWSHGRLCGLVDLDSVLVVPGLIQFGERTFKSTAFTTCIDIYIIENLSFWHKLNFFPLKINCILFVSCVHAIFNLTYNCTMLYITERKSAKI